MGREVVPRGVRLHSLLRTVYSDDCARISFTPRLTGSPLRLGKTRTSHVQQPGPRLEIGMKTNISADLN